MPKSSKSPPGQSLFASNQPDLYEKSYEEEQAASASQPVECLGQSFPNDTARREHFLALLAEKLKDPEFRKIEGFPLGKDEDILAISDPPYYTACPNPWVGDFIKHFGTPYDPAKPYHREPYVADVSEGKNHPIYNAHSYHTKVPHRAIMRYILHYTEPGDLVFDGFCGTGMTGVASQACGDKAEIRELGYRLGDNNAIINEEGKAISHLGSRRAVLDDLAPIATFIAANYNTPISPHAFGREAQQLLDKVAGECGWMFETKHKNGAIGRINYTVWSEVFSCPECVTEIVFVKEAFDRKTKEVRDEFQCPNCQATLTKNKIHLLYETHHDSIVGTTAKTPKRVPVIINFTIDGVKYEKEPDSEDLAKIEKLRRLPLPKELPNMALPDMQMGRVGRMQPAAIKFVHQFFLPRAAHAIACLWRNAQAIENEQMRNALLFFVEQAIWTKSVLNRYRPSGFSQVNQYLSGVFYVPSQHSEPSPWYVLEGKAKRLVKTFALLKANLGRSIISTQDCSTMGIKDQSVDYIFTDPPFGENIYYSDLNLLIESWHRVTTNPGKEAIVDKVRKKELKDYQSLMQKCFREYFRILKPGRWITVEFSNSQAAVWNAIQTTLQEAGFIVANVAALDKQQRSFQSVTSPTAVKQDLVISAYKPNGGLEGRFARVAEQPQGCWEFVRSHLKYLPVVKQSGGELEFITERDPRIIFDRMVAFYFQHGVEVPMNSAEFQAGLEQNFIPRDGMVFLPEQATEYDRRKLLSKGLGQRSLLVDDERSAIDWLTEFLKKRPSEASDIAPQFMEQLRGSTWKKGEAKPELRALLHMNFLCYNGTGDVPSQIHSYLSTNFPELRKKEKNDSSLQAKAKDRWFVPDPNNAIQIEKMRERDLLRDFDAYKLAKERKIKEFRIEALRAGFKKAWQEKDYATIIAVAAKIPDNVIQEDPQLLRWHTNACTRAGVDA